MIVGKRRAPQACHTQTGAPEAFGTYPDFAPKAVHGLANRAPHAAQLGFVNLPSGREQNAVVLGDNLISRNRGAQGVVGNPRAPQAANDGAGALDAVGRAESEQPEKVVHAMPQRQFDIFQRRGVHLPRRRGENVAVLGSQLVKENRRVRQRRYIRAPLFPMRIAQIQACEVGVGDDVFRDGRRSVRVRRLGGRPQAQRVA